MYIYNFFATILNLQKNVIVNKIVLSPFNFKITISTSFLLKVLRILFQETLNNIKGLKIQ